MQCFRANKLPWRGKEEIMRKLMLSIFQLIFLITLATPISAAERRHRVDPGHNRAPHWRGDIRNFHQHDFRRWSGGRWYNGPHGGRSGWWWIVGPTWYFYSSHVYPYPDAYLPPVVVVAPPLQPPMPPQYWYYCTDPPGYYPYVSQCLVNWQAVPSTP